MTRPGGTPGITLLEGRALLELAWPNPFICLGSESTSLELLPSGY